MKPEPAESQKKIALNRSLMSGESKYDLNDPVDLPASSNQAVASVSSLWPRGSRLAVDAIFFISLACTFYGIAPVFTFHVSFAALTFTSFAHTGRRFLIRAAPGLVLIIAVVARAVQRDVLQADELYEIPILVMMMAFAAWSVQLHRRLFDEVQRQSDRLRNLHAAGQMEYRDQLLLAQRLETFGQLSAGVAHNLRNLLTTVLSEAERIEDEASADTVRRSAKRIQHQTEGASQMITDMLHHAHPPPDSHNVDLTEAVRAEQTSLDVLVGPGIDLHFDITDEPLVVQTTRSLIEQVLLNLVLNARDSIEDKGSILVSTGRAPILDQSTSHEDSQAAVLTVADTGAGMDAAIRQRAFEPFFSTKEDQGGVGLGLYTSLVIVEDAGGTIHISDGYSNGAEIVVTLPLADVELTTPRRLQVDLRPDEFFGTEHVLVVEDDDYLRDRLCDVLLLYGYSVSSARDGAEGLELMTSENLDLVVSDVVMPEMNGPEMIAAALAAGIDWPVLFTTAHDRTSRLVPDGADLLTKPFGRNVFLGRVRHCLDRSRAEAT